MEACLLAEVPEQVLRELGSVRVQDAALKGVQQRAPGARQLPLLAAVLQVLEREGHQRVQLLGCLCRGLPPRGRRLRSVRTCSAVLDSALHYCSSNTSKDSPAQQEDSQAPAPIPLHDADHINRRTRLLTSRRLVAIAYTALHRVQAQLLGAQRFMRGRFACYVTR